MKPDTQIYVGANIPKSTHRRLAALSKANFRSLADQVRCILNAALDGSMEVPPARVRMKTAAKKSAQRRAA